jgi:hypothetical protein
VPRWRQVSATHVGVLPSAAGPRNGSQSAGAGGRLERRETTAVVAELWSPEAPVGPSGRNRKHGPIGRVEIENSDRPRLSPRRRHQRGPARQSASIRAGQAARLRGDGGVQAAAHAGSYYRGRFRGVQEWIVWVHRLLAAAALPGLAAGLWRSGARSSGSRLRSAHSPGKPGLRELDSRHRLSSSQADIAAGRPSASASPGGR